MGSRSAVLLAAILPLALSLGCRAQGLGPGPLKAVADLPLPGACSRFDYASLDSATHRLFLNHMGAGEVVVVDTRRRAVVAVLKGFPRCTGILAVPARREVYVSVPGEGAVAVLDADSLKELARLKVGDFPDGLAFDPVDQRVFVSDESGGRVAAIDARTHRLLARIPMGGEVGNTQYDPGSGRIYSNVQTRAQLVAIDPKAMTVAARLDLPGAEGNHGLLIDAPRRRAFVACEGNGKLLVVDLATGRVQATFPAGRDPDVLAFDPGTGRLVVACEAGPVALFHEDDQGLHPEALQRIGDNAHVVAVDPDTHEVFFPLKRVGRHPALRIVKETADPTSLRDNGAPRR
ncbi:MAG TPA: YncE family protein [Holophagaceae bacterium]|nr:YncE family protein [Holophagaceae bacterium]